MKRALALAVLMLGAACASGDDDAAPTTREVTTTTAPSVTSTTAAIPPPTTAATTTTSTTTTAPPTTTTTVDPLVEAAAQLAGTHIGQWMNETFGSVGGASFTIGDPTGDGDVEVVLDLDGSVFGLPDPEGEAFTVHVSDLRDGLTLESELFGTLMVTVTADGSIEVIATEVPVPGIAAFTATAVFTDSAIVGEYLVEFDGGGSAGGVFEVPLEG